MRNIEAGTENLEKKFKYTYREYSTGDIIFECIAKNIIEADKLYKAETGKDPEKQNNIGCSIKEVKELD